MIFVMYFTYKIYFLYLIVDLLIYFLYFIAATILFRTIYVRVK